MITGFGSARITRDARPTSHDDQREWPHMTAANDIPEGLTFPKAQSNLRLLELTLEEPDWTLRWAAPEVLSGDGQDLPSDMWALGWICWEVSAAPRRRSASTCSLTQGTTRQILTGRFPFEELQSSADIIKNIIQGKLPAIRADPRITSSPAVRLNVGLLGLAARHKGRHLRLLPKSSFCGELFIRG